jgi:hypothetical protein
VLLILFTDKLETLAGHRPAREAATAARQRIVAAVAASPDPGASAAAVGANHHQQPSSNLAAALAAVNSLAMALAEEADDANELACRTVLPLLRAAGSGDKRVAVVREGITALHSAALEGTQAAAGVQRGLLEALRGLGSSSSHPVGPAAAGSSNQSRKRPVADVDDAPVVVDSLPCEKCGQQEGDCMLVCEYCCRASTHLACAGLKEVPHEVWVCTGCVRHRAEAQEAADLDQRWLLGTFPGYKDPFWGRVSSMNCFAQLQVTFSDGEVWQGVKLSELKGQQLLDGKISLQLQPEGCVVPSAVLKRLKKRGC